MKVLVFLAVCCAVGLVGSIASAHQDPVPLPPSEPHTEEGMKIIQSHPSYGISTGEWWTSAVVIGVKYMNTTDSRFVFTDAAGHEAYVGIQLVGPPCTPEKGCWAVVESVISNRVPFNMKVGPLSAQLEVQGTRSKPYTVEILPPSDFPVIESAQPANLTAGVDRTVTLYGTNFADKVICSWWRNCGGNGGSIVTFSALKVSRTSVVCPVPSCVCLGSIGVTAQNVLPDFPDFKVSNTTSGVTLGFTNNQKSCPSVSPGLE